MASITNSGIQKPVTQIETVEVGPSFRHIPSQNLTSGKPHEQIILKEYHPQFRQILGWNDKDASEDSRMPYTLLLSSAESTRNPFFHNGCAYLPGKDELYVTSDLLHSTGSSRAPTILISRIVFRRRNPSIVGNATPAIRPRKRPKIDDDDIVGVEWSKLRPPSDMPMPSGAIPYKSGVLYCSQGSPGTMDSGGLWYMAHGRPPVPILTQFFGRPFNSIHAVTQDSAGGLWFTDPDIGFELQIRPTPRLPGQVYRTDPEAEDLRVVADGFGRPTGISFSPDERTLYVSDTGAVRPSDWRLVTDPTRPATIYAFDVVERSGNPFLANKRVFAYAMVGVPRAIRCDDVGNVYAACGDGVEIWSPGGTPLGLIQVPGGCSNLSFGREGELFICAEQRLWWIPLGKSVTHTQNSQALSESSRPIAL